MTFPSRARPESHDEQQHFFRVFELDYAMLAKLVVAQMTSLNSRYCRLTRLEGAASDNES